MSWIWPKCINPELPLTKAERRSIQRAAWELWWANKWNIPLFLTLPAVYLLTVFVASDVGGQVATMLGASGLVNKLCRAASPILLFVLCFVVGGAVLRRYRFAPCVHQATRRQGYDVCAKCGYWLRGLDDEIKRCPECGAQREPLPKG